MNECQCSDVCELGYWPDQFQPATRELMVFTKSSKRFFDLDAVRHAHKDGRLSSGGGSAIKSGVPRGARGDLKSNPTGAPPLDWWEIPSPDPEPPSEYQGEPMTATFYVGDVLDVLGKLPENSVDLVLSSPPFLALRSYLPSDHPDKEKEGGSQSTPGEYIDWLLDVVEACDRVLAPHGSLCFELGDTYSGSGGGGGDYLEGGWREGQQQFAGSDASMRESNAAHWRQKNRKVESREHRPEREGTGADGGSRVVPVSGGTGWALPKSLSLIPESFRFAMVYGFNPFTGRQTERWRLRNVIRWVRPNPPVGALGDKFRPATSELMVFCKSAKRYFDLDSVREPYKYPDQVRPALHTFKDAGNLDNNKGREKGGLGEFRAADSAGAPPLDWWNIPPGGYEGAHYAVWPPELLIKPIKAMCPEQVCRTCGEARRRITDVSYDNSLESGAWGGRWGTSPQPIADQHKEARVQAASTSGHFAPAAFAHGRAAKVVETLGFTDCGHADYRPGLVLDPFVGSGTTLAVATGHGRDAIGIDLDARNYDLALERVGPLVLQRGELAA